MQPHTCGPPMGGPFRWHGAAPLWGPQVRSLATGRWFGVPACLYTGKTEPWRLDPTGGRARREEIGEGGTRETQSPCRFQQRGRRRAPWGEAPTRIRGNGGGDEPLGEAPTRPLWATGAEKLRWRLDLLVSNIDPKSNV